MLTRENNQHINISLEKKHMINIFLFVNMMQHLQIDGKEMTKDFSYEWV